MIDQEISRPARERHVLDESEGFEHVVPLPRATVQRLVDEALGERVEGEGTR